MIIQRNHKHRGFTLTEFAVVLGLFGVIVGAIWVFMGEMAQSSPDRTIDRSHFSYRGFPRVLRMPGGLTLVGAQQRL